MEEVLDYKSKLLKLPGGDITLEDLWIKDSNENSGINPINSIPIIDNSEENPIVPQETNDQALVFAGFVCTLPQPHSFNKPNSLTIEEKESFKIQAFQNHEPSSAGPCPMFTASLYSPAPFSAGNTQARPKFEAFSDFTQTNSNQMNPPHTIGKSTFATIPNQIQSNIFGMGIHHEMN